LRAANGLLGCLESTQRLATVSPLRSFLLVLIASSFCFNAVRAFGQNSSAENSSNTIRGTVLNAVTNQPIGRALVYSTDNRYATFTNGEGQFEFTLPSSDEGSNGASIPTSTIMLFARKPGFLEEPDSKNQKSTSPGTEVTLYLTPEALIVGRITLPAGDSARGVSLQVFSRQVRDGMFHWQLITSVSANSMGEFRVAELHPGTYKLSTTEWRDNDPDSMLPGAQHYGYPPVYFPNITDFSAASAITLTAGETVQADFSLTRQPYYPVKIPVANAEENGGLNVTVSPEGQRGPGYSLGYNRAHSMIEGELPNGKYLIEGFSYGVNPSAPGMNFSSSGSANITVAGAPVSGPGIILARDNPITVNVKEEFNATDSSSRPAMIVSEHPPHGVRGDIQVTAEPIGDFEAQRGGYLRPPRDPNDESMVLENLSPGKYWLRLSATRGYVASATMGGTDLLREPLVVVPGANAQIDITLRDDTGELEGSISGSAASPVESSIWQPRAYIYCLPLLDSTGQFSEITVGPDGKFENRMITPGSYRVIAFDSPQRDLPYRDAEAMKAYESKGQVVHIGPGEKVSLQLQPIPGD
jgi:hypothetical protein